MSIFRIEGGHPLSGSVRVQGAKNSVLPILAAAFLSPEECVIHDCPHLTDVEHTLSILRHLGCRAEWEGDSVRVDASAPQNADVPARIVIFRQRRARPSPSERESRPESTIRPCGPTFSAEDGRLSPRQERCYHDPVSSSLTEPRAARGGSRT